MFAASERPTGAHTPPRRTGPARWRPPRPHHADRRGAAEVDRWRS
jgi:hypothetical protein